MPRSLPEPLPQIMADGDGGALRVLVQVRFGVPRTGGGRRACLRVAGVPSVKFERMQVVADSSA